MPIRRGRCASQLRTKSAVVSAEQGSAETAGNGKAFAASVAGSRRGPAIAGTACQSLAAPYSITSSARDRIDGGMVRPSAFAVLRLMTNSNVVGCTTGRSAGLAPLRIFPA